TWGLTHSGLFTFPQSTKHVHLYQRFGFWPRFLTALMSHPVRGAVDGSDWLAYSSLSDSERASSLRDCAALTDALYPGLDLTLEIQAVAAQSLGETILIAGGSQLEAFAVCHCGAGTEAGSGTCYVKFGAVRPGPGAADSFVRLLDACDAFAAARG